MSSWRPSITRTMNEFSREDLFAGMAVGVMAIPQSMAYAMLADLEPIYGLYTALVPPFVYALLGGSKQLHVGPVSMVSLLTATCIKRVAVGSDPAAKAAVATLIAVIAGVLQIVFGLSRLGSLVSFATLPIISGFSAGAAVVVIVAQLQHIFGISVPSGVTTVHSLVNTLSHVVSNGCSGYSFVLGVIFLAMLWGAKHLSVKHPDYPVLKAAGPLVVVCFGTVVTYGMQLYAHGVAIIGDVPSGLPSLTNWGTVFSSAGDGLVESLASVGSASFAVAFISFMESIAVAKTLAVVHGYEVDANRELIALGTSMISGSFFNGYGGAGAFSRSAVASGSGAKSQGAAVVAAAVVGLTLLFLTPLFYYLPKGVLAAIVLHAVWGLIKIEDFIRLKALSKRDATLWVVAFLGTLYSVSFGLMFSVGTSVCLIVKDTTSVSVERCGAVSQGGLVSYAPSRFVPAARVDADLCIVRVSGMLHGGSLTSLRTEFERVREQEDILRSESKFAVAPDAIIDASGIVSVDTTGLEAFFEQAAKLLPGNASAEQGGEGGVVYLAALQPQVQLMVSSYLKFEETRENGRRPPFSVSPTIAEAVQLKERGRAAMRSRSMV